MASKKNAKARSSKPPPKKQPGCRRGRPPKYKTEYARMAKVACEEGGFTDLKLAALFNVDKSTITNWKKQNPEFLASIKAGKDIYDTGNVETSFLKRAIGYRFNETTSELMWIDDPKEEQPTDEEEIQGVPRKKIKKYVVTRKVRKDVPPETRAAFDWLCNRNPGRWRKLKHVELSGPGGKDLIDSEAFKAIMSVFPSQIAEQIKLKVIERLEHT